MSDVETLTPASPDLTALSSSELSSWRLTGDIPSSKEASPAPETAAKDAQPSTEAASSPAAPDAQATSTDVSTPAASEPATPKRNNAETRIKELLDEVNSLKQQLGSRPSEARPTFANDGTAASSPAARVPTISELIQSPDLSKPPLTDADIFAQFPDATITDITRYAANYEIQQASARQHWHAHRESLARRTSEVLGPVVDADPSILEKVPALFQADPASLMPAEKVGPMNVAVQEILDATNPAALIQHFAAHPAEAQALAKMHPAQVIRTIAKLDTSLSSSSVPPKPTTKVVSDAPAPPPSVGKKPQIPGDELDEALASNDVARYMRIANAREMAGTL